MSEAKYTTWPWSAPGLIKKIEKAQDIDIARERLIDAALDLLEALQETEELDELLLCMHSIEKRRSEGLNGIDVDNDELAVDWQYARHHVEEIRKKRSAAIAKATGQT